MPNPAYFKLLDPDSEYRRPLNPGMDSESGSMGLKKVQNDKKQNIILLVIDKCSILSFNWLLTYLNRSVVDSKLFIYLLLISR